MINGFELRAWDIKDKKMYLFGDSNISPCRWVYDGTLDDMFDNASVDVVFMQSVGKMRYKNSNEKIFEGDIVRYNNNMDYVYVIKYIEEDCQFRAVGITNIQSEYNLGYKICDRLVKVGTIYENPELLVEKK